MQLLKLELPIKLEEKSVIWSRLLEKPPPLFFPKEAAERILALTTAEEATELGLDPWPPVPETLNVKSS